MACGLVMLLATPNLLLPIRVTGIVLSRPLTRISERAVGRRIPCHCLLVPAVSLIAAHVAPVEFRRALSCRHRCQSSINTVTRYPAQELIQTGLIRYPVNEGLCGLFPCHRYPEPSDL